MITSVIAAIWLVFSAESAAAPAATAAPPPCAENPAYSQLDFWVGEWDLSWSGGAGRNTITKGLDGCAVIENFGPSPDGLVGVSYSTYATKLGIWRQTWVDNQGSYFALTGGPKDGKFVLVNTRIDERMPHFRMVFEDITADSLTWRWQRSTDGEAWEDQWVIKYTRRNS